MTRIAEVRTNEKVDPTLRETRKAGSFAFHDCVQNDEKVPFAQHVKAAEVAATELFNEFNEKISALTVSDKEQFDRFSPFYLTVKLEKFEGCSASEEAHEPCPYCHFKALATKRASALITMSDDPNDIAKELLARLPKLIWGLRKTFVNKKAARFAFYFEWEMTVDSARLGELKNVIRGVKELKLRETTIQRLQREMRADKRENLGPRKDSTIITES